MAHYIAVNAYRSSTSAGFTNTWHVYRCTRAQQRDMLRRGLPVQDQWYLDADGRRQPCYSTMGIRLATAAERRRCRRVAPANWID